MRNDQIERKMVERRHWQRRGSSWLALLLLTFGPRRPSDRRYPFDRRARVDMNVMPYV